MPDDLLAEASAVLKEPRTVRMSAAEIMVDFAQTAIASAVREREIEIADELDEQILSSASTSTHIDLAYYVHKLRGETHAR